MTTCAALADRPSAPDRPFATNTGCQFDRAYGELRQLLQFQRIPDGQRIREKEWTRRLSVSRNALREAMARLEAEGLLAKLPRAGYAVPDLTRGESEEAYEARALLEVGAVELLCRFHLNTPTAIRLLERACEEFEMLALQGYRLGLIEADWRFHERLVTMAGNKRLMTLFRRGPVPFVAANLRDGRVMGGEVRQVLDDHRSIVEALRESDALRAGSVLRRHLIIPSSHEVASG